MDKLLRTFVTIVEKGNFTRAAEESHLTQSAVSREMKVLEIKYKASLFERTNKYVRLTKAGEILYHHAKDILFQYERIERLIADLRDSATGVLAIGSGYTFGEYILPHVIFQYKSQFPAITPKITIKNSHRIAAQVLRHELDIGIVESQLEVSGLLATPFARDEMVVIVPPSHPLAGMESIDLAQLANETWILRETGSGTRDVTNQLFSRVGISPISSMEFGSSQVIKESVGAGLGISIISEWAIRKEVAYGILSALKIKDVPSQRDFCYVLPATKFRTKATDLFITQLAQMSNLMMTL